MCMLFAILKPDEKVPQIVLANHHFKIAPIPLGSTMDQVQTWISSQQWEAKPVKPLSGDCWLCVAEKRFDVVFAQWNGNPVLIRWMEDRKEHSPVILAGDMQRRQPAKKNDSLVEAAPPAASGVNDDPWSTWIANKGGTGICPCLCDPQTLECCIATSEAGKAQSKTASRDMILPCKTTSNILSRSLTP